MPHVTQNSIFDRIRETCAEVLKKTKLIKINEKAIDSFLDTLDWDQFKAKTRSVKFPIRFDSVEEEVNFIAFIDILNFASGFRVPLHKYAGRGAYETICYGALSMALSGHKINADFLSQISISDIEDYYGFPISVEKEIQNGITTLAPSELKPLAELLVAVMNDTGKILRNRGFDNLGAFILDFLSNQSELSASALVEKVSQIFPAFNDKSTFEGKEVLIYKKAQLLCGDLYKRFGNEDPRFNFKDIKEVTVFTDNVLPAVLRKLGIAEYDEKLAQLIDSAEPLLAGEMEVQIRSTAIPICDAIVARAQEKFKGQEEKLQLLNALELDYYLWAIGKDKEFRSCHRHSTRDTVFY